jgi:hypothetical protein
MKEILCRQNYFLRPGPPDLLLDDSAGGIARERSGGWIGSFLQSTSTTVLHAHISPGGWTIGPLEVAVQRRRLTPSTWSSYIRLHSAGCRLKVLPNSIYCTTAIRNVIGISDFLVQNWWWTSIHEGHIMNLQKTPRGNLELVSKLDTTHCPNTCQANPEKRSWKRGRITTSLKLHKIFPSALRIVLVYGGEFWHHGNTLQSVLS